MSRSGTWKIWVAIIAILVFSGLLAALWPTLQSAFSVSGANIQPEPAPVVLIIPPVVPQIGGEVIVLPGFLAMIAISVLVIGAVVTTGLVLGVLYSFLARWTRNTEASESFQERNQSLTDKEKTKLQSKQAGREAIKEQRNDYSTWSVIATSGAILLFTYFAGWLVARTFFPTGYVVTDGQVINMTAIVNAVFLLVALIYLVLRFNRARLAQAEAKDAGSIPWDTIAVVVSGFLIVGVGIGITIYLNAP